MDHAEVALMVIEAHQGRGFYITLVVSLLAGLGNNFSATAPSKR
jgi:hypothetical protein